MCPPVFAPVPNPPQQPATVIALIPAETIKNSLFESMASLRYRTESINASPAPWGKPLLLKGLVDYEGGLKWKGGHSLYPSSRAVPQPRKSYPSGLRSGAIHSRRACRLFTTSKL